MTTTAVKKKKHSTRRKAVDFTSAIKVDSPKVVEDKKEGERLSISIAESEKDKRAAYALAYEAYLEQGYAKSNPTKLLINDYDRDPSTKVLVIKDKSQVVVGTATLVFGHSTALPSLDTFPGHEKRYQNNSVELSRLAVRRHLQNDAIVLFKFLSWAYFISRDEDMMNKFIVEVNPKHVFFYEKVLGFSVLSGESPCLLVESAPAILMSLPFARIAEAMVCKKSSNPLSACKDDFKREIALFVNSQKNLTLMHA